MSFQLSVGSKVPLPTLPVAVATGAAPGVRAAPQDKVVSKEGYDVAARHYASRVATYAETDSTSAQTRAELNREASAIRAEFEQLRQRLASVQGKYRRLRDHDDATHDKREEAYDALATMYNSLSGEARAGAYRAKYPIESSVNAHDTSHKFRGEDGKLTGPITEQATDRTPDWLDTLTSVVAAVLDGWKAKGLEALPAATATNTIQRSHRELAEAVRKHARLHINETWRPAVMLCEGETVKQHVQCAYDWDDLYEPSAKSAPGPVGGAVLVKVPRTVTSLPVSGRYDAAPSLKSRARKAPLGTAGLQILSINALTEIGNQVESRMRVNVIKRKSAENEADVAARVQRLSVVAGVAGRVPWYKQ